MSDEKRTVPKVSVILSVYNVSSFLRQCMDSLTKQTLTDIEIICVDDESTDNSLSILKEYAEKDPRIKVVTQTHGGAGKARNTGIKHASGDYLSILDSDDFYEPDMLEQAYNAAEEHDAEIVVFRTDFFNQRHYTFEDCNYSIKPSMLPENNPFGAEDISDRIFNIGCGWAWDKLYRRSFVAENDIEFQEIRTTNDMLFVFYLYTRAKRIYFLDKLLIHQRTHASASLSVTRERSWNNFYLALSALKQKLVDNGTYPKFRHSFVNWALNFSLWHIDTISPSLRQLLVIKCRREYFRELDILGNDSSYFINPKEYERMTSIMSSKTKVSVIVPVYNGERYLKMCLSSICSQSLRDIQIICVDDGSTDSTPAILKEFAEKDDRILVITKEHTNAGDCRNAGLELAEGDYLSFLDADDFFESYMLESAYETAVRDNAQITAFRCNQYDERSGDFRDCPWTLKTTKMPKSRPFSNKECADVIFTMTSCTAWDKLYEKQFILDNNIRFQDVPSCNDMLFTFSAYTMAERITIQDQILIHQRVGHPKHLCQEVKFLWHNFYDALYALKEFMVERGCYEDYKRSYINWAADFSLWNMHNYHKKYRTIIRNRLRKDFFENMDISTADEEMFDNPKFYEEIRQIMSEPEDEDDGVCPRVSVIISAYNAEAYIGKCLDTVIAQTLSDIEIIVVDDGSDDGTPRILREYQTRDERIKVITKEHTNAGEGRNMGLDAATGLYLAFLDADDFFEPDMLERAFNRAREHHADVCIFGSDLYNHETKEFSPAPWTMKEHRMPSQRPFSAAENKDSVFNMTSCSAWNKLFRRKHIIDGGFKFQSNLICNDMLFTFSSIAAAERITTLPDTVFVHQRIAHPKAMANAFEYCTACYFDALYVLKEFLEEKGLYEDYKRSFVNWALDFSLFTMHSYKGAFGKLVRQQLKFRGFDLLDISDADESDIDNKDQYREMREILSERREFDPEAVPTVSVVMPLFNVEKYLPTALDDVIFQTFEDIEIICVDDGSEDNTLEILKAYSEMDSRIRIIEQKNAGAGAARNRGLKEVRGEYVIFLDGDDIFSSELIETALKRARETGADITAFNFTQTNAQGVYAHRIGVHTNLIGSTSDTFNYLDCPERIMTVVNPTPWNKLYRTAFIREHNILFEEITSSNDITFASVTMAYANKIAYIPDELLHYNRGLAGSITAAKSKRLPNVIRAVTSAIRQVKELPYYDLIAESAAYFAVDNFVFALKNNVLDYHDPLAKEYYNFVHDFFNQPEFADLDESVITNPILYARYRVIKEVEYERFADAFDKEIIVSLTSYPARIPYVAQSVKTLLKQNMPASRILLWLAAPQFPGKENDLPADLLELTESSQFEIRWCDEDLGPHKKYYYTMQEYPESIVITVDDDLLYRDTTIEELFRCYLLYPEAVSAVRTHLITFNEKGAIDEYSEWLKEYDGTRYVPSRQAIAIGVEGVLYPPGLLRPELFDKDAIRQTCLYADDLWLKAIECASGIPVVCASPARGLRYVPDSQDTALWKSNVDNNRNDTQLKRIIKRCDTFFGKDSIRNYILGDTNLISGDKLLYIKNKRAQKELKDAMRRLADAERNIRSHQKQLDGLKNTTGGFKIYSSVQATGASKGSSLREVFGKMNPRSILVADAVEFRNSNVPSRYGIVEIIRLSKSRAVISFYSKEEGGDARMFTDSEGMPNGTWYSQNVFVPRIIK